MDDLSKMTRRPTMERPLLGLSVLVVEDSRYASEALRLLCLRSGARIRRADCLRSAQTHLRTYRPSVAIIDLGLPDGSGLDLIQSLSGTKERPTVLLATSGLGQMEIEEEALAAGADGFLPKPVESLSAFQQAILAHLPAEQRPKGVRALTGETITPDPFAMNEDLAIAAKMLDDEETSEAYIAGFLRGVAETGHDAQLMAEADEMLSTTHTKDIRARVRKLLVSRLEQSLAV